MKGEPCTNTEGGRDNGGGGQGLQPPKGAPPPPPPPSLSIYLEIWFWVKLEVGGEEACGERTGGGGGGGGHTQSKGV